MAKNQIQEQRMKGYFIQATKDILKGEGLKHISVRNIAQKAGYSYATLYNYFKDVKDLIFECVKDFQDEAEKRIMSDIAPPLKGTEKIKSIATNYISYFVEYPGIFELFFIEKASDLEHKQATIDLINSFLNRLCNNEWEYLVQKNKIEKTHIEAIKQNLNYTVVGLLLLYNHRKYPGSYQAFKDTTDQQLNLVLNPLK